MHLFVILRYPDEADIIKNVECSDEEDFHDLLNRIKKIFETDLCCRELDLFIHNSGLRLSQDVCIHRALRGHEWVLAVPRSKYPRTDIGSIEDNVVDVCESISESSEMRGENDLHSEEEDVSADLDQGPVCSESRIKFAFVCVLWHPGNKGLDTLIANAMTLGYRLRRHSKQKRIVLATKDIMREPVFKYVRFYWEVREIEDIHASPFLLRKCDFRFSRVFTKLRVMQLCDFDKIVMLDADLLPRANCDELFLFMAPSAMMRGNCDHIPGEARRRDSFYNQQCKPWGCDSNLKELCECEWGTYCNHWSLLGGINAGVVLLEPSAEVFEDMQDALNNPEHRCHVASTGPEQDFLTRWYHDCWHSFSKKYNWQLHQSFFVHKDKDLECERFVIDYEDLRILHFSTDDKPAALLFQSSQDVEECINHLQHHQIEKARTPKIRQMLIRAHKDWYESYRDAYLLCSGSSNRSWQLAARRCVQAVEHLGTLL